FSIASSYDELVGLFVLLSCLQTKCRLAPRCTRTRTSDTGLAFTTTMRMVVGVHNRTADCRSDTHVTLASSFTDVDKVVVAVANYADRSAAYKGNHSHLAGGK